MHWSTHYYCRHYFVGQVMLGSLDANARAHDLMTMAEVYRANPGVVFAMGTWGYTDARPLSPHVMVRSACPWLGCDGCASAP